MTTIFNFLPKITPVLFASLLFVSCEYNNEKDLFGSKYVIDGTVKLTYFQLDGNLEDEGGNETTIITPGNPEYTIGITEQSGDSALILNGLDQYIKIYPDFLDTIAISLWFKGNVDYAKDMRQYKPTLIDYGYKELHSTIDAYTYATVVYTAVETDSIKNNKFTLTSKDEWHHLYIAAGGTDSTKLQMYLFGYQIDEIIVPREFNPLSDVLYIGRASNADDLSLTFYNGCIDEIRIYDRFLSDDEIQALSDKSNYLK